MQVGFQLSTLQDSEVDALVNTGKNPALVNAAIAGAIRGLVSVNFVVQGVDAVIKLPVCQDGVCAATEVRLQGLTPGPFSCPEDCPFELGTCPAPGQEDAGRTTVVRRLATPQVAANKGNVRSNAQVATGQVPLRRFQ